LRFLPAKHLCEDFVYRHVAPHALGLEERCHLASAAFAYVLSDPIEECNLIGSEITECQVLELLDILQECLHIVCRIGEVIDQCCSTGRVRFCPMQPVLRLLHSVPFGWDDKLCECLHLTAYRIAGGLRRNRSAHTCGNPLDEFPRHPHLVALLLLIAERGECICHFLLVGIPQL